jgi:hypothetical protein
MDAQPAWVFPSNSIALFNLLLVPEIHITRNPIAIVAAEMPIPAPIPAPKVG